MKHIFSIFLTIALCAGTATAQEEDAPSLIERGMQQFLEGLLEEMEPAIEGMSGFLEQMGPAMATLLAQVEDWSVYEPPEMLENGDIIIRRKSGKVPDETPGGDRQLPPQVDL